MVEFEMTLHYNMKHCLHCKKKKRYLYGKTKAIFKGYLRVVAIIFQSDFYFKKY